MASLILNFLKWIISFLEKKPVEKIPESEKKPDPPASPPTIIEPKWIQVAKKELGVAEFPGDKNNPEVMKYFLGTRYRPKFEDSWCSAFANYCMQRAGIEGTGSAAARSWLNWGIPTNKPKLGTVCVFWRESKDSAKGHVGFFIYETDAHIFLLGGNQGDKVCFMFYPKAKLLGYRNPSVFF